MDSLVWVYEVAKENFHYEVTEEELRQNSDVSWNFVYVPIVVAMLLTVVRYVVENHIFRPLGILNGLKPVTRPNVPHNALLEQAFRSHPKRLPTPAKVLQFAKELSWSERQVQRWFRLRMAKDKTPKLVKFTESGWRFTFYTLMSLYIIISAVRLECDWLFNVEEHHRNFPYNARSPSMWKIYILETGCYIAAFFSLFTDVRRKDFVEMSVHHILAVIVPAICWYYNSMRYGILVYLTHDVCDIFLELAKMLNYIKWKRSTDACFAVFTIVWVVCRLYIYPFHLLWNAFFNSHGFMFTKPYYIINYSGILLFMLHLIWTYYIFKVLFRVLAKGEDNKKDSRSSSSDNEISDDEENGAVAKKKL